MSIAIFGSRTNGWAGDIGEGGGVLPCAASTGAKRVTTADKMRANAAANIRRRAGRGVVMDASVRTRKVMRSPNSSADLVLSFPGMGGRSRSSFTRRELLQAGAAALVAPRMSSAQTSPAPSVKALVFDTFGTVVDWRSSVAAEVQQLAKRKGLTVD